MSAQLDELHEEAGRVLEDLRTVLPERNLRVPDVASAAPDEHKESDLEACDSESDVDGDGEACDSDVDGDRDLSESQDADSDPNLSDSEDADDCLPRVSHAWTFPKAHAMCHATTTIRLFGPLEGSSGESLEKRHVAIKDSFQRTNNKPGSELQVLCSEMRKDDTWTWGGKLQMLVH